MSRFAPNLAVGLLLVASSLGAQLRPPPREDAWKQVCGAATARPLPTDAISETAAGDDSLRGCDVIELYYGIEHQPDPAAAFRCASYQRAHDAGSVPDALGGSGILAMMYANGTGVPLNYDLAIRFACESHAPDGDKQVMIPALEARRAGTIASAFDICENSLTTPTSLVCAGVDTGKADKKRRDRIGAISRVWPASARTRFTPLEDAERAFEDARVRGEISHDGTGQAVRSIYEEATLRDQFLINLERFAKGDTPQASQAQLQAAERSMDEVYRAVHDTPDVVWDATWGCCSGRAQGIEQTQRAWTDLRDAWLAFAPAAYPKLSIVRIRSELVHLRLHQLQSIRQSLSVR